MIKLSAAARLTATEAIVAAPIPPNLQGMMRRWDQVVEGFSKSDNVLSDRHTRIYMKNVTASELQKLEKFAAKHKDNWEKVVDAVMGENYPQSKKGISDDEIALVEKFLGDQ
jgi:hypothetical protein